MRALFRACALAVAMTLWSSTALAASRVVIVRPLPDTPVVHEAVARLRAELAAAGFEVIVVDAPSGTDPRSILSQAAERAGAFAAITVFGAPRRAQADLWVVDRVTHKTVVRTVTVGGSSAPADLAVRAAELLEASLLEADPERQKARPGARATPPLPPDVRRWIEPSFRKPRSFYADFGLQGSLGLLHSFDGIGPAACPVLRLSYGRVVEDPATLAGRIGVAGPCAAPDVEGTLGVAAVRQEAAMADLVFAYAGPRELFVPFAVAGAGVYHLRATGTARTPYVGRSAEVWAALFHAGIGGGFRMTDRASIVIDAQTLFTQPRAVVTFAGASQGAAGRPSLLVSLGLLAAL